MHPKWRHRVGILLLIVGLFTACIAAPRPTGDATDSATLRTAGAVAADTEAEPVVLKVGTLPFLSNTILKIAQEEGYFSAQGLAVELIVQQSSTEFIPLLLQGELDVATPALTAGFFNAVASGGNIKLVLPLTNFTVQECTSIAIIARRADVDAGTFATPAQWQGAKMTFPPAGAQSIAGYVVDQALHQQGLSLQSIENTLIDLPAQAEALRTGQTDLIYAIEPWITRMTADPALALLLPAEPLAADLTSSLIAFGAKPLADPALGQRFAIAYLQAVRQYGQGKTARNIELAAAYTKLEPALVEQICWSSAPPDGAINVDSIMDYQQWLQEQGLLDRLVTPAEFLDHQFVEAAIQSLGEVTP